MPLIRRGVGGSIRAVRIFRAVRLQRNDVILQDARSVVQGARANGMMRRLHCVVDVKAIVPRRTVREDRENAVREVDAVDPSGRRRWTAGGQVVRQIVGVDDIRGFERRAELQRTAIADCVTVLQREEGVVLVFVVVGRRRHPV